jgi:hypothetical protein
MPTHNPDDCSHINLLPPQPAPADLPAMRKGLRRRKPPLFEAGFHGRNPQLGEFRIEDSAAGLTLHWQLPDGTKGSALTAELCTDPALETARLTAGWLVANMFRLDGIHICESIGDPHETMRVMGWFGEREDRWRHWALVPPGHMRLPATD